MLVSMSSYSSQSSPPRTYTIAPWDRPKTVLFFLIMGVFIVLMIVPFVLNAMIPDREREEVSFLEHLEKSSLAPDSYIPVGEFLSSCDYSPDLSSPVMEGVCQAPSLSSNVHAEKDAEEREVGIKILINDGVRSQPVAFSRMIRAIHGGSHKNEYVYKNAEGSSGVFDPLSSLGKKVQSLWLSNIYQTDSESDSARYRSVALFAPAQEHWDKERSESNMDDTFGGDDDGMRIYTIQISSQAESRGQAIQDINASLWVILKEWEEKLGGHAQNPTPSELDMLLDEKELV